MHFIYPQYAYLPYYVPLEYQSTVNQQLYQSIGCQPLYQSIGYQPMYQSYQQPWVMYPIISPR
jgi:hypothetical protein